MKYIHAICAALVFFLFFFCMVQPALAEKTITLDFFYSGSCSSCQAKFPIIQELEQNETYNSTVIFNWKDETNNESARQEYENVYDPIFRKNASFPLAFVVIKNETNRTIIILDDYTTVENITRVLNTYITGKPFTEPSTPQSDKTPGFDLILILGCIALVLFMKRKRIR